MKLRNVSLMIVMLFALFASFAIPTAAQMNFYVIPCAQESVEDFEQLETPDSNVATLIDWKTHADGNGILTPANQARFGSDSEPQSPQKQSALMQRISKYLAGTNPLYVPEPPVILKRGVYSKPNLYRYRRNEKETPPPNHLATNLSFADRYRL